MNRIERTTFDERCAPLARDAAVRQLVCSALILAMLAVVARLLTVW
jgi:hypothetical protein